MQGVVVVGVVCGLRRVKKDGVVEEILVPGRGCARLYCVKGQLSHTHVYTEEIRIEPGLTFGTRHNF